MAVLRYTHTGICVSDLERSLRFYCDVLGFEQLSHSDLEGEMVDRLNEREGVKVTTAFIERDGTWLELMEFREPGWIGSQSVRPMHQLGLTHLAFRVDDFDALCARIEAAGGSVLSGSRIDQSGIRAIMATDPDGLRVELLERPGPLDAIPGT